MDINLSADITSDIQARRITVLDRQQWQYYPHYHAHRHVLVIIYALTHLGLTLFYESPPGAIREIEGFATHICVTREMGAVLHDAYMRHQAKMS